MTYMIQRSPMWSWKRSRRRSFTHRYLHTSSISIS